MRLRFGKREKLVIGGIAGILLVGILHLAAFAPNAKAFVEAKRRFNQTTQQSRQYGSIKNQFQIDKYNKETKVFEDELADLIGLMMIGQFKNSNGELLIVFDDYKVEILKVLKEIITLGEESKSTEFVFLGDSGRSGWGIPTSLPLGLVGNEKKLRDILSKLQSKKIIVESIMEGFDKQKHEAEYHVLLRELGVDLGWINNKARFPDPLPLYKLLMHAELIRDALPPDESQFPIDVIYKLLRVDFYGHRILQFRLKQLNLLKDLLELAIDSKVEKIVTGGLLDEISITIQKEGSVPGGTTAAISAVAPRAGGRSGRRGGSRMMMRGGRGGRGGGRMFGGIGARGGAAPSIPQPKKADQTVIHAVSLDLNFQSTNLDGMNFLYNITHLPRTYEIDGLVIRNVEEGNIDVYCRLGALWWIEGTI